MSGWRLFTPCLAQDGDNQCQAEKGHAGDHYCSEWANGEIVGPIFWGNQPSHRVFLGPLTARPCPRCPRVLRRVGPALFCPDRTHCLWRGAALDHQTEKDIGGRLRLLAGYMVLGVDGHSKLQ